MSNKRKPDVKALIRSAKLPEKTVPVCLHADLVAEVEQAERELTDAQRQIGDSLAGGSGARDVAERIEALRAQMLDSTVEFTLRAMPRPTWRAFLAEHPPRKDGDQVDERDKYVGVNTETFFDALVRRSTVSPELDDEDWRILFGDSPEERKRREAAGEPVEDGKLTDRQFDQLSDVAWALNRREVDVPFSLAASRILRNSEPE